MTIKELSKYYYIQKQVLSIRERIEELEATIIGTSKITGIAISHSSTNSNPLEIRVENLISLKSKLEFQLNKLIEEETTIQDFIDDIEDIKIQTIVRLRFIELKKWEEVAEVMNYSRVAPYLQLKQYLNKYNEKNKEVIQ